MKKLLLLCTVLMLSMGLYAQDYTGKLTPGKTYKYSTALTTLTNTDTVDIVIDVQQHQPFTVDVAVTLDSISGNPTGTVYLEGRKADTESWTAIDNTVWDTNDETVIVAHATAVRYRELRIRYINGGTGITDLDAYWVKLWLE